MTMRCGAVVFTLTFLFANAVHAALFAQSLPPATGRYPTARAAFHWVDEARLELETRVPDDKRELLVYVFYPSRSPAGQQPAPYMPESAAMAKYWDDDLTRRLTVLSAHSVEGADVAGRRERFPVVVFAPGGGQKALAYTTLLEDLASYGYIVAAMEPPHNAPAMQFPDGRVVDRLTAAERGWEEPKTRDDTPRIYEQMVLHWSRDMVFVLDRLTALNAAPGPLSGRLDLARVGAFGHSRGGQAAGTVRLLDSRFRGAINIDGNIRGRAFQWAGGTDGGHQPFMWIEKYTPTLTDAELDKMQLPKALYQEFFVESDNQMRSVRGGSIHVTVRQPGIEHLDFSDNPFWSVSMMPDVRAGKLRTLDVTRAYVRAFFEGCLKGRWNDLRRLTTNVSMFPEASSRRVGRMWR